MSFIHTRITDHVLPKGDALEASCNLFSRFQDIPTAEALGHLSLAVNQGHTLASFVHKQLVRKNFINDDYQPLQQDRLSLLSIVAINMVYAEISDNGLYVCLHEPFRGIEVLGEIFTNAEERQLIISEA
ncbi:hypothetical protein KC952_02080 [Candidatus Saccharibacteria bacterium]|jgi:hypothetical protein|nr:hypothetical protein [Candidatus Saccharibacteria bacterium]